MTADDLLIDMPASAQACSMTAPCEGPCGEVRLLERPSWLMAELASSAKGLCEDDAARPAARTATAASPRTYLEEKQRALGQ